MEDEKFGLAHTAEEAELKELATEVGRRLRTGEGVTGGQANTLTKKLEAAWNAWNVCDTRAAWNAWDTRAARAAWYARDARDACDTWDARAAWDARDARDAQDAFIIASRDKLLELLRECV
jgi:hypothetical protein